LQIRSQQKNGEGDGERTVVGWRQGPHKQNVQSEVADGSESLVG
jgi:hypothetical protein